MSVCFKTAVIHDLFRAPEMLLNSNFLYKIVNITFLHFWSYIFLAPDPSIIVNREMTAQKPKDFNLERGMATYMKYGATYGGENVKNRALHHTSPSPSL
jgi:hypothetical protein